MKPVHFQRRAIQLSVLGSFYKNPRYSLNMSVLMLLTKIKWHHAMCLDGPSTSTCYVYFCPLFGLGGHYILTLVQFGYSVKVSVCLHHRGTLQCHII